jgi:RNA polymerase sigma factor (sigma-70 family)
MSTKTDAELVASVARGQRDPFGELFDRHANAIYRYAWSMTRSIEDARDVVQEVFLVAWRRRDSISFVADSALPWLLATCRHVALNSNRSRRRDPAVSIDPALLAEFRIAAPVDRADDELADVFAAIATLAPIDQEICRLCISEGKTYAIAAAELGITPTTVGKRLERLRRKLRQKRTELREATS